jgi:hypothetical protein
MKIGKYLFRVHSDIIHALWCVDSESSREFLVDLDTSEIIAERVAGKIVDPEPNKKPH